MKVTAMVSTRNIQAISVPHIHQPNNPNG